MEDEDIIDVEHEESGGNIGDGYKDIVPDNSITAAVDRARTFQNKSMKVQELQPRLIMEFVSLGGLERSIIGIRKLRALKKFSTLDPKHRGSAERIVKNIIVNTCKEFMPQDTMKLIYTVFSELGCKTASDEALKKFLTVFPAHSI